jgi:hypothetical protein
MNGLAVALFGFAAAAGLYVFTLRRIGGEILSNGGFEDDRTKFNPGGSSRMVLTSVFGGVKDWAVRGTINWSQERGSGIWPQEGEFFLDLVGRSGTGPTGGVGQGVVLQEDRDYELSVYVGSHPSLDRGPVAIRVTVEDTAPVTRFTWDRTSNPSSSGMKWERLAFRFDTRGWIVNAQQSGAIYIDAPRELNRGRELVGIDKASLFLLESTFSRFFR